MSEENVAVQWIKEHANDTVNFHFYRDYEFTYVPSDGNYNLIVGGNAGRICHASLFPKTKVWELLHQVGLVFSHIITESEIVDLDSEDVWNVVHLRWLESRGMIAEALDLQAKIAKS